MDIRCSYTAHLKGTVQRDFGTPFFFIIRTSLTKELTLTQAAKGPKGLSCFVKQTGKHFLKLKKFKNLGILGKFYVDYFLFYNN